MASTGVAEASKIKRNRDERFCLRLTNDKSAVIPQNFCVIWRQQKFAYAKIILLPRQEYKQIY